MRADGGLAPPSGTLRNGLTLRVSLKQHKDHWCPPNLAQPPLTNAFKQAFKQGRYVFGCWLGLRDTLWIMRLTQKKLTAGGSRPGDWVIRPDGGEHATPPDLRSHSWRS